MTAQEKFKHGDVLDTNELLQLELLDRIRYVIGRDSKLDTPQKVFKQLRKLNAINNNVMVIDISEEMGDFNGQ